MSEPADVDDEGAAREARTQTTGRSELRHLAAGGGDGQAGARGGGGEAEQQARERYRRLETLRVQAQLSAQLTELVEFAAARHVSGRVAVAVSVHDEDPTVEIGEERRLHQPVVHRLHRPTPCRLTAHGVGTRERIGDQREHGGPRHRAGEHHEIHDDPDELENRDGELEVGGLERVSPPRAVKEAADARHCGTLLRGVAVGVEDGARLRGEPLGAVAALIESRHERDAGRAPQPLSPALQLADREL